MIPSLKNLSQLVDGVLLSPTISLARYLFLVALTNHVNSHECFVFVFVFVDNFKVKFTFFANGVVGLRLMWC